MRAKPRPFRPRCEVLEDRLTPAAPFAEFVDPHPAADNNFGYTVTPLSTGNVVVTSPYDDAGATDAGAVYLFNGATGALISTLTGSHASDRIGLDVIALTGNGNFVIRSYLWGNGSVGAVTWGSGTTGVSGVVSAANSLVGSTASDNVGYGGVTALTNGNYVVDSYGWGNGAVASVGAVTWCNGTTGTTTGAVTMSNSLVGTTAFNYIGYGGITTLNNGNYVVNSPTWDYGALVAAGAVTFRKGDGTSANGAVTAANSLVGSSASDRIGFYGVTALTNGNYAVNSPAWHNGVTADAGAVTWGNGSNGTTGPVGTFNSLYGTSVADQIGSSGVTALTNGNYTVASPLWNRTGLGTGLGVDAGAATWASGVGPTSAAVSVTNSLVGGADNRYRVGSGGVTALTNGNYVVASPLWNRASNLLQNGAVTWGNGVAGTTGPITESNSQFGGRDYDHAGSGGVVALANGNYVAATPEAIAFSSDVVGAVAWGDGAAGTTGGVGAYGASNFNSLSGTEANDRVGSGGVVALANGNYVVLSSYWGGGTAVNAGAVTWGNGTAPLIATPSASNSLVGRAYDYIGFNGVTALTNGNYVVNSVSWQNNQTAVNAGAVTWGSGTTGTVGAVGVPNSLYGAAANDQIGNGGVTALPGGNYVVKSTAWPAGTGVGAVTWASGTAPTASTVSAANSLVGSGPGAGTGVSVVSDTVNGNFYALFPYDGGGRVRAGSIRNGLATLNTVYVNAAWAGMTAGTVIPDADPTVAGDQPATVGVDAFPALAPNAVSAGGTMTVFNGTYAGMTMDRPFTLNVPSGTVTISGKIGGSAGLTKAGVGILSLTGTNTYAGGTTVNRGRVDVASNNALGQGDPVTVNALGELRFAGGGITSRTFILNAGTLTVNSGVTLTGGNATFAGGFLNGPGTISTFAFIGVSVNFFAGTTIRTSLAVIPNGNDTFTNVRLFGALTVPFGRTSTLDGFTVEAPGRLVVDGTANASDVTTYGTVTVGGSLINTGGAGFTFGSGVTTVNAGGTLNTGSATALVNGGLVKNYGAFGSGTQPITVDYGGRVQGTGTFGTVTATNGGVFSPGSSPGGATLSGFAVSGGGTFDFEITNATGNAGGVPSVNGWDTATVAPNVFSPASASINFTATAADKFTVLLSGKLNDGVGNTAGLIDNFSPGTPYAWKFLDGSNPATTVTGAFSAAAFTVVTAGFANPVAGTFGVELGHNGADTKSLYLAYTPGAAPAPAAPAVLVNGTLAPVAPPALPNAASRVTSLVLTFNTPVTVVTNNGAFTLTNTTTGAVLTSTAAGGIAVGAPSGNTLTLTFTGTTGVDFTSLADGVWTLTTDLTKVRNASNVAGTGTGTQLNVRRLFGDSNGDGTVDGADYGAFGATFGQNAPGYNAAFDFNNDGTVDGSDFGEFGARFGQNL